MLVKDFLINDIGLLEGFQKVWAPGTGPDQAGACRTSSELQAPIGVFFLCKNAFGRSQRHWFG